MVEHLCPICQEANPIDNRFCGQCGASLQNKSLVLSRESGLTVGGTNLPAQQLKQIGQAVAVGLVTLAAEAGLAYLRNRVNRMGREPSSTNATAAVQPPKSRSTALVPRDSANGPVAVISQRVVEVWQQGRLTGRLIERTAWWRKE